MATTLVATGRIIIPYQVDSVFTHRIYAYVRNPQLVGAVYNVNSRTTDANDTQWDWAASGLAETISYMLPIGSTFGTMILQLRSGSVWTPVASFTFAGTNHAAGTLWPASQFTLSLRDTLFRRVKVVLLDANYGSLAKSTDPTAGPAQADNFMAQFTSAGAVGSKPYAWMVGRGNTYLAASPIISWVSATNRKMRRARGLA